MKTKLIALSAAAAFAAPALADPLPIQNGSFEGTTGGYTRLDGGSTAINGWTTTGEGVEWFDSSAFGPAFDGNNLIDLAWYTSNGNPGGGIQQTIATEAGTQYSIAFHATTHRASGRDGTGIINLLIDGVMLGSYLVNNQNATFSSGDWKRFDATFTATGPQSVIQFTNTQNAYAHFAYLDGVSTQISAVPEPAMWAMMIGGLGMVGGAMRSTRRKRAVTA